MLRVENIRKSFGGIVATDGLSLTVPGDSLTAVIGPNGAGKTTFFNQISGALQPDSGRILFQGQDITGLRPAEIVRRGIGRTFQVASLFKSLTVEETLQATLQSPLGRSMKLAGRFPLRETRDSAREALEQLGLASKASRISGNLSHGDQKLLDMAIALVLKPKLLLLDEPVAGMGPEERERMIETVHRLWKKGGLTLLLIEHDMEIVFRISQRVYVLSHGSLLAEGTPQEVRSNPAVIEAYLGSAKEERT